MDRKTELEQKKAKLEQLRLLKAQKAADTTTPTAGSGLSKVSSGTNLALNETSVSTSNEADLDKILIECGITAPILTSSNTPSSGQNSLNQQPPSQSNASSGLTSSTKLMSMPKTKKPVKLSVNQTNFIEIPPRELVTYSKETQTPATDKPADKETKPVDYYVLTYDNQNDDDETPSLEIQSSSNLKNQASKLSHKENKLDEETKKDELNKINIEIKEANDEERIRAIQSEDFSKFFSKNAKILERALDQDDIFFDYSGADRNKELRETGEILKFNREFHDDNLKNRSVTWLDWSPQYPELLLASYEESQFDLDGVALVWNSKFKSTVPEYTFNCSSWVTSCCFAKFHPNLIIGGTYSGQIVMWDNRSNKRTPIQRSSLSAASHTHPVYCIQVVGSQNAHNLITISNDGKLCSWTLDNMNTPQETLDLQCKQAKNVAVTTMAFRSGDVNNFVVGSEEGPIYTACRHGNKSGINDCFDGHFGPVTGLSCNQAQGPIDFSHIFLTSSFDWSIKLWNCKEPGKALYSFENNSDYVYDVAWSPINPTLFASIDGTGRLELWDLLNDAEVPISTLFVDGAPALNKLRWTINGLQIAVGDDQGKISIFDVHENYAQARPDDWTRFVRVLQDFKENSAELDESLSGTPSTATSGISSAASSLSALSALANATSSASPLSTASTPHQTQSETQLRSNGSLSGNSSPTIQLQNIKSDSNLLSSANMSTPSSILSQLKSFNQK